MPAIYSYAHDPAGGHVAGAAVTLELIAGVDATPGEGFRANGETVVQGVAATVSDATGRWEFADVAPSVELVPDGTAYRVSVRGAGRLEQYLIQVPAGPGPYWAGGLAVALEGDPVRVVTGPPGPPGATGPQGPPGTPGLDQATADARYVNLTGDVMTGRLATYGPTPQDAQIQARHLGAALTILPDDAVYTVSFVPMAFGVEYAAEALAWTAGGTGWTVANSPLVNRTDGDARYVNTAGDTMTGGLSVANPITAAFGAQPSISLTPATDPGTSGYMSFYDPTGTRIGYFGFVYVGDGVFHLNGDAGLTAFEFNKPVRGPTIPVVRTTAPVAADYGTTTLPTGAIWIDTAGATSVVKTWTGTAWK